MIPHEGTYTKNNSIDCFECGEITFSEFYIFMLTVF